jgi:hypothetical protein
MPLYVLNRNFTLRTTAGHIINFEKGQPVNVPPIIERDALQIGAEPVEGERPDMTGETVIPEAPQYTADERKEMLFAAFDEIVARNAREEFTAQGAPNKTAVEKVVGFEVSNKERTDSWFKYKEAKATE